MQIECAPLASELLATGFADRRLEVFRAQIARLFRESGTVLAWEERGRLTKLEARVLSSLDELYGFGLPETLVHGDLHFGNVVETVDGPLLFDWTDAAVAHPFLDLFTLLGFDLDSDGAVRQSYLEPWQTSWDGHDLDRGLRPCHRSVPGVLGDQLPVDCGGAGACRPLATGGICRMGPKGVAKANRPVKIRAGASRHQRL